MMSWHGNVFCFTGSLWGESIGYQWFPSQRARNAELCCLPEWAVEKEYIGRWSETPRPSPGATVMSFPFSRGLQAMNNHNHRNVIMSAMLSQTTAVSMVCSTVCLGADQRKRQCSASLALVTVTSGFPSQRASITGARWIPLTKSQ